MNEQAAAEEEAVAERCTLCYCSKPRDVFIPCSTCNQELHLPCLLKWQADGGVVKCPFCNSGLSPRATWYVTKARLRNAVETRTEGMTPEVRLV
jgi:transcription elongation factor Elf1